MTSNQIAYAGVEEQKRHNTETEQISRDANRISDERNEIEDRHRTRAEDIQKEYNDGLLRLQHAQGDERNRISAELNEITLKKNNEDTEYKKAIAANDAQKNSINMLSYIESKRHNQQLEILSGQVNILEGQRLRAEQVNWQNQAQIALYNADTQRVKMFNETQLGLFNLQLGLEKNKIIRTQMIVDAATNLIKSTSTTLPILTKIGG